MKRPLSPGKPACEKKSPRQRPGDDSVAATCKKNPVSLPQADVLAKRFKSPTLPPKKPLLVHEEDNMTLPPATTAAKPQKKQTQAAAAGAALPRHGSPSAARPAKKRKPRAPLTPSPPSSPQQQEADSPLAPPGDAASVAPSRAGTAATSESMVSAYVRCVATPRAPVQGGDCSSCIYRDAQTVPPHLRNAPRDTTLLEDLEALAREDDDTDDANHNPNSSSTQSSFVSGPDVLADLVADDRMLLTPAHDLAGTMDGAQKCLQLLPRDDPSLLVQPYDGATWAFMARCIGDALPRHITDVLYFFHSLRMYIETFPITGFVAPAPSVRLLLNHKAPFNVLGTLGMRGVPPPPAPPDADDVIARAYGAQATDEFAAVPPFNVRVGFTGAFFREDEAANDRVELFCVVFVTPVRTFDLASFVLERFLVASRAAPGPEARTRFADSQTIRAAWDRLVQYEAFENIRLPPDNTLTDNVLGKTGSRLEADRLFHPLSIPFRARTVLQRLYPHCTAVRIIGFPQNMAQGSPFAEYYLRSLDHVAANRDRLVAALRDMNRPRQGASREDREARDAFEVALPCPAGFPVHPDPDAASPGAYRAFALPPLPLMMNWSLRYTAVHLSVDTFRISIGKLPKLVSVHLRRFLTYDPDDDSMDTLGVDHFMITDRTPATPYLILERFYGPKSNPLDGLSTAGCLQESWLAMRGYLRKSGGDPALVGRVLHRYLRNCIETHRGMIFSGAYPSLRIQQALQVLEACPTTDMGRVDLHRVVTEEYMPRMHASMRHDPYQRASALLMAAFADINKEFVLNAGNLEVVVEMMVSSIAWLMGSHNDTFKWFFQGLQIVAGYGHFRVTNRDMDVIDVRKPNSSGADFSVDKLNRIFLLVGSYVAIPRAENMLTFTNTNRWTPVSLENQACYEIVKNEIVGKPSPEIEQRSTVATELRGDDLCSVIKNVYPRHSDQPTVMLNTVDVNKTNQRSLSVKIMVNRVNFCGKCTNVFPQDLKVNEEFKTMLTVIATLPPGSAPYHPTAARMGDFNDVHCDRNQSRDSQPEDGPRRHALSKILGLSHVLAAAMVALPNRAGVMPFEIADPVLAYLDWIFLYIRMHAACVMDTDVLESFNRVKEGYESRHVVYSVWKYTLLCMAPTPALRTAAAADTYSDVAMRAIACASLSAMALTEVPVCTPKTQDTWLYHTIKQRAYASLSTATGLDSLVCQKHKTQKY